MSYRFSGMTFFVLEKIGQSVSCSCNNTDGAIFANLLFLIITLFPIFVIDKNQ